MLTQPRWYRDVVGCEVRWQDVPGRRPFVRDEAWGMREFGFRTVDGHRMMFGEPLAD